MKAILLLICVVHFSNFFCQKTEDPNIEKLLKGTWVKTTSSKDTLKFTSKTNFNLSLGKGSSRKKIGPYSFSTLDGKMTINWVFSSSLYPKVPFYLFHFENNNKLLKIENFYSADGESGWLIFEKLQ